MDEDRPPDPEPGPLEAGVDGGAAADAGPGHGAAYEPDMDGVPTEAVALEPRRPGRVLVAVAIITVAAFFVFAVLGGYKVIVPGPSPTPAPEPRIAVIGAGGALRTMNADGGRPTEYPLTDVALGIPAWSPDGTRIAATGQDSDSIAIYLFQAAEPTAAPKVLYDSPDHPPFYLYWSPDGRQIAFLSTEPVGIALRIVPADGSAEARVVRQGAPLYWDWLGSDRLVAHIGLSGTGSFLGEVDLQGSSVEQEKLDPGYFRSPAVSHDRAYRAYVTSADGTTGSVTVESADRSNRQVAPVYGIAALAFDPTGESLAFVAADKPQLEDPGFPLGPLRALDPVTGQTRTLLDGDVIGFFWAPDGRTIAALTLTPPGGEIVGVPGAGLASATGPAPGAGPGSVQAGGVGLTLVFVDVAAGSIRAQRAAQVTSRFVNFVLPYYDQYALSHRIWAPDSSAIALPLVADGKDEVFVIPTDGSAGRPLEDAELGFWRP